MDGLSFRSQDQKHELSHIYEAKLRNMGNAGRNGGEYYTPRPLIRAMVQVVKPKIGERIYDGAAGSAGFLCESFDYLRAQPDLSTKDLKTRNTCTRRTNSSAVLITPVSTPPNLRATSSRNTGNGRSARCISDSTFRTPSRGRCRKTRLCMIRW
jgi:hypothetical protein